MKMLNAKTLAVGLLVTISAAAAAPVSQAQVNSTPSVGQERVSLEFKRDANAPAQTVYRNLYQAAHNACGHDNERMLAMRRAYKKCVAEMVESGVVQLGRADIAELHKSRTAVASR